MEKRTELVFFLVSFLSYVILLTGVQVVKCSSQQLLGIPRPKLFVFGDSYADTGNTNRSMGGSWTEPYGITFPGKPAGRFSDGRVFTDYLASFLGIESPIPYTWRKTGVESLKYGMNFAYGGTGVFDIKWIPFPNMTTQIDFFQQLIHDRVYTEQDLHDSLALVSAAGNDYGAFTGSSQDLQALSRSVVDQITLNLKRIHDFGVRKIAVTALDPLGCLPLRTVISSFQKCSENENMASSFHNLLLRQAVEKLNNETRDSTFVILDLYSAFMSAFKAQGDNPGSPKFENPLKPCCVGTSNRYSCGSIDEKGVKKYTICENPMSAFFWDMVHPSQEAWHQVYLALEVTLNHLIEEK